MQQSTNASSILHASATPVPHASSSAMLRIPRAPPFCCKWGYCGGYAIPGMQKYRRKKKNPCMLRARQQLRSRIVLLKRGFGPQDQAILRDREPLFPRTGTTSVREDPRRMLNPVFLVLPARRALSKGQYGRGVAGAMRHRQSFFRRLRVQDPLCTQGKDSVCPTVSGVSWRGDNLPPKENAVLSRKRERGRRKKETERQLADETVSWGCAAIVSPANWLGLFFRPIPLLGIRWCPKR